MALLVNLLVPLASSVGELHGRPGSPFGPGAKEGRSVRGCTHSTVPILGHAYCPIRSGTNHAYMHICPYTSSHWHNSMKGTMHVLVHVLHLANSRPTCTHEVKIHHKYSLCPLIRVSSKPCFPYKHVFRATFKKERREYIIISPTCDR
jgi:hypothetical protein